MDARKEIGQRIARARRCRGLSQTVLAGLIGRSESWLSQVERGQRSVDSHSVINVLAERSRRAYPRSGREGTFSSGRGLPSMRVMYSQNDR